MEKELTISIRSCTNVDSESSFRIDVCPFYTLYFFSHCCNYSGFRVNHSKSDLFRECQLKDKKEEKD
jgi:hypothetical protein